MEKQLKKFAAILLFCCFCCFCCFLAPAASGHANPAMGEVFTADDFNCIPGFRVSPDRNFKDVFVCPDYDAVIEGLGEPKDESDDGSNQTLKYDFGEVILRHWGEEEPDAVWIYIHNDKLEGPRGIKVGDPYEKVLAKFKNNLDTFPEGEFRITLYEEGARPGQAYSGYASVDSETGRVMNLYYWHGNMYRTLAISVNFIIQEGIVATIVWRIDERA